MRCPTLIELPPPPPDKIGWPWIEESPQLPDGNLWPKMSIVTPSFNQGQYIEETIRSILLQGYPNLEYIIIDGGSTDNTIDIIKKYEKYLTYWISEPDRGQGHAINKGLALSTGNIANWLNSDDTLEPNALLKVADLYHSNPSASLWVGGAVSKWTDTGKIKYNLPYGASTNNIFNWFYLCYFIQPAAFFNLKMARDVGLVNEELFFAVDPDLYMRLASKGCFVHTDHILATEKKHPDAKTVANSSSNIHFEFLFHLIKNKLYSKVFFQIYFGFRYKLAKIIGGDAVSERL